MNTLLENIKQDKVTNMIFIVDRHLKSEMIKTLTIFLEKCQFSCFKYGQGM